MKRKTSLVPGFEEGKTKAGNNTYACRSVDSRFRFTKNAGESVSGKIIPGGDIIAVITLVKVQIPV
jgi:hypothetical protein